MSSSSIQTRLDAVRAKKAERDSGFTLIELLVVVVIIGILVAIAIPLYLQYQNGAKNKSAESDLRGAISTIETFYGNHNNSYADSNTGGAAGADVTLVQGTNTDTSIIKVGTGNQVNYVKSGNSYLACSWNTDGKHMFTYNGATGGSVTDAGTVTALPATCISPN